MGFARRLLPLVFAAAALTMSRGQAQLPTFAEEEGSMTRLEGGGWVNEDTLRTARETAPHSVILPNWANPKGFEKDVFTFARVIFKSNRPSYDGFRRGRRLGWYVDYPDADLNLSYRLQQLTSLAVDPDGRVMKITNPDLFDFPLLIMIHVEGISLTDEEASILRRYFHNGGSLFVTDFWGADGWENFRDEMRKVFPGKEWTELTADHPLFRSVFQMKGPVHRLRVPTMQFWNTAADPDEPKSNLSLRFRGEGSDECHIWAMLDENQRIMAIVVHNSDLSDGWERESENEAFFKVFSEPRAYPFAINAIFYLMTH